MDYEEILDYILRLAGIGLVVVGLNALAIFFLDTNFLSNLPEIAETITYIGALIGAIDNTLWALTRKGVVELKETLK